MSFPSPHKACPKAQTPPPAAAGAPVQPEAIIADFLETYPSKSAIPNRAYK
jgi:hypothetical protein